MTKSAVLGLPQVSNNKMVSFNQYDTTILKELFAAGANDSVLSTIGASSSDTATRYVKLYIAVPALTAASITRSSSTATLTFSEAHGLATGSVIIVSGANESEYNGQFIVTEVSALAVSYTVSGTPNSPATGTILVRRLEILTTVPVTISGGKSATGAVVPDNLLLVGRLPWMKLDAQGNLFMTLKTGYSIYAGMVAAVTAAKNVTLFCQGADY